MGFFQIFKQNYKAMKAIRNLDEAFMVAAKNGDLQTVQMALASSSPINGRDRYSSMTALMTAAAEGHTATVNFLLENHANPNLTADNGATALEFAAAKGRVEVVWLLLKYLADVNAADAKGGTPLMLASWHGHEETVQLLLENGAVTDRRTVDNLTALSGARERGHYGIADKLIAFGARQ